MTIQSPGLAALVRRWFLLLIVGSAFLPLAAHALNVLQNGSFEASTFNAQANAAGMGYIDGSYPSDVRRATVPNWTWTRDPSVAVNQTNPYATAFIVFRGGAQDGSLAGNFGGGSYNGGGTISQNFAATQGSIYNGSLWVRRGGSGEPIGASVTIRNNLNNAVVTTVPINMSLVAAGQWKQITFSFTAPSNTLSFAFTDTTPVGSAPNTDLELDNVRIETTAPQTLTILGANGAAGSIEANTDYSKDGGATWHPAYLFTGHPWGYISGTNAWLNQSPSPFVGLNERVDFRIRFFAPATWAASEMTYQVNADNEADILINGTQVVHTVGGPISSGSLPTQYLVSGVNTIFVRLIDYGGWVGLNYRLDVKMDAAEPLERLTPPPSITSPLTASGNVGTPFSYTITATNSPTSRTASNLPPGLSVNSSTGVISGTPTATGVYPVTLTASSNFGSGSNTLYLTIGKGVATVMLGNLTQVYDGSVKSASATTSPSGLLVDFTYTGASVPPINVGNYTVFGVVNSGTYSGSASAAFKILPAAASVSLGNLSQGYNGSPRSISVTTAPAGLSTSVTYSGSSAAPSAVGSYPVAATVTNPNYTGSASGTLTISDVTAPVLTIPTSPIVAEATSPAGAPVSFTVSALDDVNGNVLVTTSAASGSTFALGNTVVTATAKDAANNTATGNFTITVRDTTAPVLTLPSSQTLEATSAAGAIATFAASATDAVGATVTYSIASGSTFALGVTPVNVSAVDAAGNQSVGSFTITVVDTTAPVIEVPANIVTEATSATGAIATFTASAFDIVDGNVFVSSSIASGSTFALGTTPVTLTATDAAGNVATAAFSVTVTDTTAPVIAAQDNLIVEATSADGAVVTFTPSSLDIVSGAVSVIASPASGSTFPLGVTLVTLTATDAAGNTASGTFTITVVDTTAPSIATPANLIAEATSAAGAVVTFELSANDIVDGALAVDASPVAGSTFPIGTTTVTLNSIDAAGNLATSTFTVTVRDTIAPVIAPLANQTHEATGPSGAVASYATTADDAVGATLVYVPVSGSVFALGNTAVTVTAFDAANNTSAVTFAITVQDTTAPTLVLPISQTLEATGPNGASALFNATAFDIVSGSLPVAFTTPSGSTFSLGSTNVVASAVDAAANVVSGTFAITVVDTTAPVISAPASLVLEATSSAGAVATFSASAFDIVSGNVAVGTSKASGATFALGTTTVTLSAADAAGNTTATTFTVTVNDTTAPTITVPEDIVINSTTVLGAAATFSVTANDIVDGALTVTLSQASGTTFAIGTTVVTATVTDAAGNTSTKTFNVTVNAPAAALVNVISGMNGTITGSIQQLDDQNVTLNGGAKITGELLVVGTPSTRLNGKPVFGGAIDGTGSISPSNYTITLNGNAALGKLVRRMDPIALPTVAAPSNPTGTRSVNLNKSTDPIGAWATLKDLTLNGNVGTVAIPAGVYGNFTANGNSGFKLGVAGATTPSVYHFQNLTLNGNSAFQIVGPVIIVLRNGLNANGSMGNTANPAWLDLRISHGGLTLNGNVAFHGYVTAPLGTVIVNGNSALRGGLAADRLVLNGNSNLTLLRR